MEAEERIARVRARRGETQARIDEALDAGALDDATEAVEASDLYLASLARYVEALGGHLEVRAVFADESILVRRAPEDGEGQDRAGPSERPRRG
ncbi:MAG: hypothetical protein WAK93_02050 [Solirubrobacteraceae bacterium]